MIAVTGASGKLGRLVIEGLLKKESAKNIVALVRDPQKITDLTKRGIQVRKADYSVKESLLPALERVNSLLLVSSNEMGQREAQHRAVVEAAKQAGVQRIAYTSVLKAHETSVTALKDHKTTEDAIRASGIPFIFLRNGWYIENYTENLTTPLALGAFIGSAGNGRIAAASRSDFAAAAATVLTEEGHTGKTYELAGDEGFTIADLAKEVSNWCNRLIGYTEMPAADYTQALISAGLPEPFAVFLVEADLAIAAGELDSNSRDLHQLIGRTPLTLKEVLATVQKP